MMYASIVGVYNKFKSRQGRIEEKLTRYFIILLNLTIKSIIICQAHCLLCVLLYAIIYPIKSTKKNKSKKEKKRVQSPKYVYFVQIRTLTS